AGRLIFERMLALGEGDAIGLDRVLALFVPEVIGGASVGADLVKLGVFVSPARREDVSVDVAGGRREGAGNAVLVGDRRTSEALLPFARQRGMHVRGRRRTGRKHVSVL